MILKYCFLTIIFFFVYLNSYAESPLDIELKSFIKGSMLLALKKEERISRDLALLGRKLFVDVNLSGPKNISCMDCHHPRFGASDNIALSIGEGGIGTGPKRKQYTGTIIKRHSPHLFNLGYPEINFMFWDGRVSYNRKDKTFKTPEPALNGKLPKRKDITNVMSSALSAQVIFPLTSHEEMRGQAGNELADAKNNEEVWKKIMKRVLKGDDKEKYLELFKNAYPDVKSTDDFNIGHAGEAMAGFIKNSFSFINTPYDSYLRGNNNALTISEKKGLKVFLRRGHCVNCHGGKHLSNFQFRSSGVPQIGVKGSDHLNDKGRFEATHKKSDMFKFKTPALRNLAVTGPYMHDGIFETIEDVVEHYSNIKKSMKDFKINPYIQKNYQEELVVDLNKINNKLRYNLISVGAVRRGLNLTDDEKKDLVNFLKTGILDYAFQPKRLRK